MKKPVNISVFEDVMKLLPIETKFRLIKLADSEKKTVEEVVALILSRGVNTPFIYTVGVNT